MSEEYADIQYEGKDMYVVRNNNTKGKINPALNEPDIVNQLIDVR